MQTKRGIPVSPGIAIFPAVVLDAEDHPIPRRSIRPDQVDGEGQRLEAALDASRADIDHLREQTEQQLGAELAKIFSFHLGMLSDPQLLEQFRQAIRDEQVQAESAVWTVMRRLTRSFLQNPSPFFQERTSDIADLRRRVLRHLIGSERNDLSTLDHQAVVVAHDLTPSQTAALDKNKIRALATDAGGQTSHTAILAHALGIPAVVGLGDLTRRVNTGQSVVIDGNRGLAIIDPDADTLLQYRQELQQIAEADQTREQLRDLPAVTADGEMVSLLANIEFPSEIENAIHWGAAGVGLYRTEFLFLSADRATGEDEQYETYVRALQLLDGRPLTVRTLDLGADKLTSAMEESSLSQERNPFLGCRSIRLCLQNLPLFQTQLRAIMRASVHGPMRLMFPLISNILELRQAKMVLQDVQEDLDDQGIEYRHDIPVGMMIEVPSAAVQCRAFAREVDFFSIGTNDLIQYTVAVDRSNERIASLYSGGHPAVIALMREVIRVANRARIEVSLCGEMAGEPEFTMLLLGMGLRNFSITPPAIPEIKRVVRSVSMDRCQKVARRVSSLDSPREVISYLHEELEKLDVG